MVYFNGLESRGYGSVLELIFIMNKILDSIYRTKFFFNSIIKVLNLDKLVLGEVS